MTTLSTTITPPSDSLPLSGVLPEFAGCGYAIPEHVTHQSVWRAVANGRLPAQRAGGRYRVLRSDLPAYAAFFGIAPPSAKPSRKTIVVSAAA